MASDINDEAELIPNHNEAWSLAVHKRGTSNLARAYLELREVARSVFEGPNTLADKNNLRKILQSNDI